MATAPIYASTPKAYAGIVPATLDTSLTAPANTTTIATAGASGTKVDLIRITILASIATTATQVNLFLYDGATYHLFEQQIIPITAISTTTSQVSNLYDKYYTNLVLQSGWSIRASVTTVSGQSNLKVLMFGADF